MLVMLQAVARAAASAPPTTKGLFGLTVTNGILGTFTINSTGDTSLTADHDLQAGRQEPHPGQDARARSASLIG